MGCSRDFKTMSSLSMGLLVFCLIEIIQGREKEFWDARKRGDNLRSL